MFYLIFHSCPIPESFIERHSRPCNVPFIGFNIKLPFQTFFDIIQYRKNDHFPSYSSSFIERLSRPHLIFPPFIG